MSDDAKAASRFFELLEQERAAHQRTREEWKERERRWLLSPNSERDAIRAELAKTREELERHENATVCLRGECQNEFDALRARAEKAEAALLAACPSVEGERIHAGSRVVCGQCHDSEVRALRARLLTFRVPCPKCDHLMHGNLIPGCTAEDREGARFCDCKEEHRVGPALAASRAEVERMRASVSIGFGTGRYYLSVAGHVVAVEGDICRDPALGLQREAWDKAKFERVLAALSPAPKEGA